MGMNDRAISVCDREVMLGGSWPDKANVSRPDRPVCANQGAEFGASQAVRNPGVAQLVASRNIDADAERTRRDDHQSNAIQPRCRITPVEPEAHADMERCFTREPRPWIIAHSEGWP